MKRRRLCLTLWAMIVAVNLSAGTRPSAPRPNAADAWASGEYRYDGAGNIKAIGDDLYVYDTVSRVVSATTENHRDAVDRSQNYAYDSFGNRLSSTTVHNDLSRCVSGTLCEENVGVDPKTNRINTNGVEYDAAGNLRLIDAVYRYTYDPVGMMVRQQSPATTQYIYTANDERIAVYSAGRWEWSVRDHAGRILRTFTGSDTAPDLQWTKDYVYRGNLLLATDAPAGRRHYHLDHLGSPRVITDEGGRKLGMHAYHAFGAEVPLAFTEQPQERVKFTGHERDVTPDIHTLDYMHARYYSAALGRFMSIDPVLQATQAMRSPQLWNRYAYVAGNPLKFVDPKGTVLVAHANTDCPGDPSNCFTRLQAFAALKSYVGRDAAKHLQLNGNGTVTLKGISALAFGKMGFAAAQVGAMIRAGQNAHFTLSNDATTLSKGGARSDPVADGFAVHVSPRAFPSLSGGVFQTMDTSMAHEFGHTVQGLFNIPFDSPRFGKIRAIYSNPLYGVRMSEGFAVWSENEYRAQHGLEARTYYWFGPSAGYGVDYIPPP